MRSWTSKLALPGMLVAVVLLAGSGSAQTEDMPIKDLRLPLERFEDGRIKAQLVAATALVPVSEKKAVTATGVKVEFYKEDGKLDGVLNAEDCEYNRKSGDIHSDKAIYIEREGVTITGKGFDCDTQKQTVNIRSEVRVTLNLPWKDKKR